MGETTWDLTMFILCDDGERGSTVAQSIWHTASRQMIKGSIPALVAQLPTGWTGVSVM